MSEAITSAALDSLFTGARTHNGWLDIPVSDETLREIYDLMKWGPTSANCSPARIVFVRSAEGKEAAPRTLQRQPEKTSPHRSPRLWRGTRNFMSVCLNCSRTGMRRAGLPPAPRTLKRPPFATAPCRPLISSLPVAPWLDTGPMSGFDRQKSTRPFHRHAAEKQSADQYRLWRCGQTLRPSAAPPLKTPAGWRKEPS